jgi:cell division transport system permease protein
MRPRALLTALMATLRRNLVMVGAVVVTATICLALLGAGLLLRAQVHTVNTFLLGQVEVVVDLTDDATGPQVRALESDLRAEPVVTSVGYESKQATFDRFRRDFHDSPAILSGVAPGDLPATLRVALTDPRRSSDIVSDYTGRAGVESVRDDRAVLAPLYRVLRGFTIGAFTLALLQATAMLALIYTLVRASAHSRRRETAIMRLVGATDAAIRAPFILESGLAGLAGGLLAGACLVGLKAFLVDGALAGETAFPLIGWDAVWRGVITVAVAGAVAGALTAGFALRRHLRV